VNVLNALACAAAVVTELALGAPPPAAVDMRVYTYSALEPAGIEEARQLAQGLLEGAGVQVTWRLCHGPGDECHGAATSTKTVFVHVLPRRNSAKPWISGDAMPASTGTRIAWVYVPQLANMVETYRRLGIRRSVPQLTSLTIGHLVGLTIAHEVGHTLGLRHSHSGIMRQQLDVAEVVAARDRMLAFRPRERERMQVTLGSEEGTLASDRPPD
jgi:hypothetical protein